MRCSLLQCSSLNTGGKKKEISYHRFPSNPELLKSWINSIGNNPLRESNSVIRLLCSLHFKNDCFEKYNNRSTLRKNAIPTKFNYKGKITIDKDEVLQELLTDDRIYNLNETCRTCLKDLKHETMMPIFEEDDSIIRIDELISIMLKIKRNDGLPQKVCNECMERLLELNAFVMICERSQEILMEHCKTSLLQSPKITLSQQLISNSIKIESNSIPVNLAEQYVQCDDFKVKIDTNSKTSFEFISIGKIENDNVINHHEKHIIESGGTDYAQQQDQQCVSEDLNNIKDQKTVIQNNIEYDDDDDNNNKINNDKVLLRKVLNEKDDHNYIGACKYCGKNFKKLKKLEKHEAHERCIKINDVTCRHCHKKFTKVDELVEHFQYFHVNKPHICCICKDSFRFMDHCKIHIFRSHYKENSLECHLCNNKMYATKYKLNQHIKRVHITYNNICPHCSKKFDTKFKYNTHLRYHNSDKRIHKCKFCDKSFVRYDNLEEHERTHTGFRPFLCEICGQDFASRSSLITHMRVHTNNNKIANRTIRTHKAIKSKIKKQEINKIFPYGCDLCSKRFRLPSTLTSHMKIHTEERQHICGTCGSAFKRSTHLRIHVNGVHLKQKPYKCKICNKSFPHTGGLNYHMLSHTGERPHKCMYPHCTKTYRLRKELSVHMRIHTGVKPYICEICNKGFMAYVQLSAHTAVYHE